MIIAVVSTLGWVGIFLALCLAVFFLIIRKEPSLPEPIEIDYRFEVRETGFELQPAEVLLYINNVYVLLICVWYSRFDDKPYHVTLHDKHGKPFFDTLDEAVEEAKRQLLSDYIETLEV